MAANVTILHTAFGDPRYAYLAELAGYGHPAHALGRMATLWSYCTERQTHRPPVEVIRACLGPDGDRHLVAAGLGELAEDGAIRMKGTVGMIEWYAKKSSKQSRGGTNRMANARRDNKTGKLLPSSSELAPATHPATVQLGAQAGPATGQLAPAPAEESQLAGLQAGSAGPAKHQLEPATQVQSHSGRAQPSPSGSGSGSVEASPDPDPGRSREHDPAHANGAPRIRLGPSQTPHEVTSSRVFDVSPAGAVTGDSELIARRTQGHRAWDRLNRTRRELAVELGLPEPMHLHDQLGGRVDLADRLRDAGSERAAELELEHVFAVAIAEARAKRTLRWLGPAMFKPDTWGRMLTMDPGDARASLRPEQRNVFDEVDAATALIREQRRARHGEDPCEDPTCDIFDGCRGAVDRAARLARERR